MFAWSDPRGFGAGFRTVCGGIEAFDPDTEEVLGPTRAGVRSDPGGGIGS